MAMAFTYPREMLFALPQSDPRRVPLVAAAGELALPLTTTDATVSVTLDSPSTAFRFGVITRKYTPASQAPPLPMPPAPESIDEHS